MLAVICLLLLLGLGHCQDNDLPSRIGIESSINRTIEEVERQVRADPSLPRLTRHEIVGILRDIASQDLNEYKDEGKLERARNLYQRALMVVLPYNAEESPGNMKDLYTKPPMTRIIPDTFEPENGEYKSGEADRNGGENAQNSEVSTSENLVVNRVSHKSATKEPTATRHRYKNHRDTYSDVRTKVPLKETPKLDSTPVRFSFDLENLRKNAYTTEKPAATRYPIYRHQENGGSDLKVIYGTAVTDEPTTKPASRETGIVPQIPKANQNVLTSGQWRYNAPPSTATTRPSSPSKLDEIPFLPTISVEHEDPAAVPFAQRSENPTEETKTENPTALYVTPMSTETSAKVKYSSTYSINSAGFRRSPSDAITTSTAMPMRPEVMDLLASIGLRPDNSTNVEDVYEKSKDFLESKARIPESSNIIRDTVSGLTSVGSNAVSIANRNTFESPGSEIKKGVGNLTPDVQLLFQRFGLRTSLSGQPSTTTTRKTTVYSNSYTNFKPLPTSNVKDEEFREFLAKFGLGVSGNRSQKSLKQATTASSVIEAVPSDMVGILKNIGLISDSQKHERKGAPGTLDDMESMETSKFHVFKPHEATVKDAEQRNRINELLDTVKLVQEGKADVRSVRKVANDLLRTTNILKDGPDPLKLEEIIKTYDDGVRNEVKRQQEQQRETTTASTSEGTTSSGTVTTESAETTIDTPTTTAVTRAASDSASPEDFSTTSTTAMPTTTTSNVMALEESFGGTTREPDPALPPKRKSGLYFLVDWNTFLEVGEEDKGKVNLRFQPKVGDRTRFLPVTVP